MCIGAEPDTGAKTDAIAAWQRAQRILLGTGRALTILEIGETLKNEGVVISPDTLRKAMWRRKDIFRFLGRSRFELNG